MGRPAGWLPDLDICCQAYLGRFYIERTLRLATTILD